MVIVGTGRPRCPLRKSTSQVAALIGCPQRVATGNVSLEPASGLLTAPVPFWPLLTCSLAQLLGLSAPFLGLEVEVMVHLPHSCCENGLKYCVGQDKCSTHELSFRGRHWAVTTATVSQFLGPGA